MSELFDSGSWRPSRTPGELAAFADSSRGAATGRPSQTRAGCVRCHCLAVPGTCTRGGGGSRTRADACLRPAFALGVVMSRGGSVDPPTALGAAHPATYPPTRSGFGSRPSSLWRGDRLKKKGRPIARTALRGSGGGSRTRDLQVMSLTRYHFSTPRRGRRMVLPRNRWPRAIRVPTRSGRPADPSRCQYIGSERRLGWALHLVLRVRFRILGTWSLDLPSWWKGH